MPKPWGHKLTFVVYIPGGERAVESAWRRGALALGDALPNTYFIGAQVDKVQDEPKEQMGT